jgi:phosphoribosyl 1,2-cyclic phosphate phosphodiesterase
VLVDTTPELRLQCVANGIKMIERRRIHARPRRPHLRLDDLRRFNAIKGGPLDAWIDDDTFVAIDKCFGYAFVEPSAREMKVFRPYLIRRTDHRPVR